SPVSLKITSDSWPAKRLEPMKKPLVVIREYEEDRHKLEIEKMETLCEVGQGENMSLVTDLMGDPICRIRHFPVHIMLVAEYGEGGEVVGVIRGCVKTVTRGCSIYAKLAYLLGLRVSSTHRRLGIGTKLISHLEEWCKQQGAEYAYMATDCTNEASVNLFTKKCGYSRFRTLTMLVQPVHAHHKPISSSIAVIRLAPSIAASIYNQIFANAEFYPKDIDAILSNKLNLGTFMAIQNETLQKWDPETGIPPPDYAIISVWNTKQVFKLQVKGVSAWKRALCAGTRMVDTWLPCLRVPSFPDVFRPFGIYVMYGLHMEGEKGKELMRSVCDFVHNMGKDNDDDDDGRCGALVTELAVRDPATEGVPHWSRFSWAEDLWCIKRLEAKEEEEENGKKDKREDWVASGSSSSSVIFVDPRDF
ncbi:probable N-acetyltransferase HLS1-like, partial [Neltuma alba]|uniref:probable N-acetyltransferase HLS1-like n=1 Tax=Neltuma alba TaxID=207710 RepID=UPI0010A40C7A